MLLIVVAIYISRSVMFYVPEFYRIIICKICICYLVSCAATVKPVLSGHSKIDKTKILMRNGSLMQGSILQYFLPALSNNLS